MANVSVSLQNEGKNNSFTDLVSSQLTTFSNSMSTASEHERLSISREHRLGRPHALSMHEERRGAFIRYGLPDRVSCVIWCGSGIKVALYAVGQTTFFFISSRRRHTSFSRDWSSDVCSSDLSTTSVRSR